MSNNFLMKKMLKSQMKGVPEDQQEMILEMVEKNPDLFKKIAKEMQEKVKSGKDQQAAGMEVMTKYQNEIQEAMGK